MKYLFIVFFISLSNAFALEHRLGTSLGFGKVESKSVKTVAIDYHFLQEVYKSAYGDFKVGSGVRMTHLSSNEFPIYKSQEIIKDVSLITANVGIYTEYNYLKYFLGFNIDYIGTTFGKDSKIKGTSIKARPVRFNNLRGGKPDVGTLNSEFWGGYNLGNTLLRAGLSHQVIEYEGNNPGNGRRQRFFNVLFVSAHWCF